MDAWEQDRENRRLKAIDDINHLLTIANAMGHNWSVTDACSSNDSYQWITITNNNIFLNLYYGGWKNIDRLIVTGEFKTKNFFNYNESRPKITIDIKRDVKLLVKSIYKRIIPDIEALRIREIQHIKKETEYKNKRNAAINELKEYGITEGRNENLILHDFSKSDIYCRNIRLTHDCKKISIELDDIPLEQFKNIMNIVRE